MMKKIMIMIGIIFLCAGAMVFPVGAVDDCRARESFLGFPTWYKGLTTSDTNCELKSPADKDASGNVYGIGRYITIIASNIISMAAMAVTYISVGFVVYGGFQYVTSSGSADAVKKAKDTIRNAIMGIIISVLAGTILNFINIQLSLGIN